MKFPIPWHIQRSQRTPLYKGHKFLAASTENACGAHCSLSPKDTSLIKTELIGRRAVLIRGGLLYNLL